MKGALGSERHRLRASDPIAPLPRGPFNLEDARIPRLTYTKKKKKNMDKMRKTFLGIIFTFGALLLKFLVYCLVFTYKVP